MDSLWKEAESVFTGNYRILAWFLLAVALIYVPILLMVLRRRKNREEDFLRRNPSVAVVRLKRPHLSGLLTVHDVDGAEPALGTRGIGWYLYLLPGKHTLSLSYQWTKVSILGKLSRYYNANKTLLGKDAKKKVTVKPYGQYTLFYDHEREKYLLTEEGTRWEQQ